MGIRPSRTQRAAKMEAVNEIFTGKTIAHVRESTQAFITEIAFTDGSVFVIPCMPWTWWQTVPARDEPPSPGDAVSP